jgi:hypothetical protein
MAFDEIKDALDMFKTNVRELQMSRSLASANEQVAQIKSSELDEHKQRAALQQVSNSLVMQMAQYGAPATTIAQVAGAIGPRQYNSPAEAAIEGSLSGNKDLVNAAAQADVAAQTGNLLQLQAQQAAANAMQDKKFAQAKALQGAKAQKQQPGDVEFGTNVDVAMKEAVKLEKIVNNVGNWEALDTKAAARLQSASYQLAINYAKIVDPASVAREGEVAAAQKYLIPMGIGTRNSVTLEAIKKYEETIKEYVQARQKQKSKGPVAAEPAPETADDITKWLE